MANQFTNSQNLMDVLIKAAGQDRNCVKSITTYCQSHSPVMFTVELLGQEEKIRIALEGSDAREEPTPKTMRG